MEEYDPFVLVTVVSYAFTFIIIYYFFVKVKRKKKAKRKKDFFDAIKEGLRTGSITTIDDAVDIYKGISGFRSEELDYKYGLSQQLREFLVELISKKIDDSLGDEIIVKWKEKISELIKKNEEVSPFAGLPSAEKNILNDMSIFLEKDDVKSVKRKISELAGMIQARHDDLNKVRDMNKWTLPLSIVSSILTVFFGILVLVK